MFVELSNSRSNFRYCTSTSLKFLYLTGTEDDFTAALILLYGDSDNCTMTLAGKNVPRLKID